MLKKVKQTVSNYSKSRRLQKTPISSIGIEHLGRSPTIRNTIVKNLKPVFGGKDVFTELSRYSYQIIELQNAASKTSKLNPVKRQSKLNKVSAAKERYQELNTMILKFDNEKSIVQHNAKKNPNLPPKTISLTIFESELRAKIKALEKAIEEAR